MTDPVFFEPARHFTAGEIAALTGAELVDPAMDGTLITSVATASQGGAGALVFVESRQMADEIGRIDAAALLCSPQLSERAPAGMAVLVTGKPRNAFIQVARLLFPTSVKPDAMTGETGLSPAAHVHAEARLEDGVIVEAGAVVAAGAAIGRGTIVSPNAVIGPNCRIGRDCHIGPGASILCALIGDRVSVGPGVRIGQDGFGYVPGGRGLEKVPQLGRVVIQDDVEIGANTAIDRGALSDTIIGEGTKIDNLVQIAHNVSIGRLCIIAGQSGLSGSVTLGDGVMLGGGVGVADHITIGARAAVAASSGIMNDIPPGERWAGTPARPIKETMREFAVLRRLVRDSRDKDKRNG